LIRTVTNYVANRANVFVVRFLVDEEGNVEEAKAVSGHPLLREAAVDAAYLARFALTIASGNPVKVSGVYRFVRVRSKVI
jgi:outer membrane biosynthesis protein TonB